MPMELNNKIAIVTGAAQGLGEHLAQRLVKEGASVALWDISDTVLKTAEKIAAEFPGRASGYVVNVTQEKEVDDTTQNVVKKYGRLDIMVANAGIVRAYEITDFPLADWQQTIEVNLTGYFLCARAAARIMKEQKSGVIIEINSKSGKKGSYKNCAYAASKFGGLGLTQSIALDLAPNGVRVNAVCPGNLLDSPLWVNNLYDQYAKKWGISKEEVRKKYIDQVPLGRTCTYEDVANAVVFLAGEQSSYITGQAINVTGGQEMR
ncbi:MAG: sorbitol-6-phosphate dehydrogenase [Candidatus Omnitrophica bacterium]|nr:sorbitol-6-phosphate dehydrogenase [Candidatus Omnitrophota bacterium]